MRKKIAVLLNGSICYDHRVIKTVQTLSEIAEVHLYYLNGTDMDVSLFDGKIKLYSIRYKPTLKQKIFQHSLFCYELSFFTKIVLETQVTYDYLWANDLPTLYPANVIARKLNAKLIYDSHEIYIETINQFFPRHVKGLKKWAINRIIFFMKKHGRKVENSILPKTHAFITVNDSILQYFKKQTTIPKGFVIMNFPEAPIKLDQSSFNFRSIFDWEASDLITIYQGNLNEGRGLPLLVEAFTCTLTQIKLVVIGDGPLKNTLQKQVQKFKLEDRIRFLDYIPLSMLSHYTRGADIGICLLEDFNLSKSLASPNKMFEYIHADLPVLCSETIETVKVLTNFKIGLTVKNEKADISAKLNHFAKMNEMEWKHFKDELQEARKQYVWEKQAPVLKAIIEE